MEPSSPSKKSPDSTKPTDLAALNARLAAIESSARRSEQLLQKLVSSATEIARLLDGFTAGGGSYRSGQIDPMVVAYAAILGPILGDRIDAQIQKDPDYLDNMMKGAAPLARQLLRVLDTYQSERGAVEYLEAMAGDIGDPGEAEAPN